MLPLLIFCLFSSSNANLEMTNSWDWSSPGDSSVMSIGTNRIHNTPKVLIGTGNVVLKNQCVSILSPSIGSCKRNVAILNHHTECLLSTNATGRLSAVGTLLNADIVATACTCSNLSVSVQITTNRDECSPGVLIFGNGTPPLTVGGISQMHNPLTHLQVARFQGVVSPVVVTACSALVGFFRVVFMQLRSSSFGFETSLFQHAIDASRFSFSCALLGAGILNLVYLLPNIQNVSIDVVLTLATAIEITLGSVCLVKSTCVRTFAGESRFRCFCRNGAWSGATYLATGNPGSVFVLLQGLFNATSRQTGANAVSENMRNPRP